MCLLMSFVYSFGQDEHLKLRFDFTNVTGAIVKDAVAKYPAKFYAPAKIDSIGYLLAELFAKKYFLRISINHFPSLKV